jgi:hypothetical protein
MKNQIIVRNAGAPRNGTLDEKTTVPLTSQPR